MSGTPPPPHPPFLIDIRCEQPLIPHLGILSVSVIPGDYNYQYVSSKDEANLCNLSMCLSKRKEGGGGRIRHLYTQPSAPLGSARDIPSCANFILLPAFS